MSKKDLLDRIERTSVPRRTRGEAPEAGSSGPKTDTRVAKGVIRRRRKAPEKPKLGAMGATRRAVAPAKPTVEPIVAEAVEPVPGPVEEAVPVVEQPPTPEPVVEAAEPVEAAPEPVEVAPAPEPGAEEAQVVVEPAQTTAKPSVEAAPPVEAEAAPETAPEAEAAPVEAELVEAAPVEEAAPAMPSLPSFGAPKEPVKSARPKLPGLGKAVIQAPDGWDPSNPRASAARANANQEKPQDRWAKPAAQPGTPGNDATKTEDRRKPAGRGRPPARRNRRTRVEAFMDDYPGSRRRRKGKRSGPKKASPPPKAQKRKVMIDNSVSVGQLAHEMGKKANELIRHLMGMGVMATVNEQLDLETAQLVATEFEYEVVNVGFQEDDHLISVDDASEEEGGSSRPPVVTVMGHVDHGKTTLLDSIRNAKVAAGEAGGITQHIGAYQVDRKGQLVTFLDTPGHEAFTEMRARGAGATDIVILVVAADDGVMPQTIESINHAKAADVPIVVAVNKCDKPGVNPGEIRQKLMEFGLVPEEYGGETMMVDVSALKGTGLDALLDAVLLVAELEEYTANAERHAEGTVLEARLEKGKGAVATILVEKGTLERGQPIVLGNAYGRVRAMVDHRGKKIKSAGPSTPVEIFGMNEVPAAGDNFVVVGSDKDAKQLAEHRAEIARVAALNNGRKLTLQDLFKQQAAEEIKKLLIILKSDVQGSLEALKGSLEKLEVEGAEIRVLHSGVGAIVESDITLASANGAICFGFNVRPDAKARRAAEAAGVEVRGYKVIYELLDDVKNALVGLLEPEYVERHQGSAEVRKVFHIPKIGAVAGCMVTDGQLGRNNQARLVRDGVIVWEGKLASLKRFKNDAKEVQSGYECGLGLENFHDVKEGDVVETFIVEAVARTA